MSDSTHYEVVIIGSGPAGFTAALYAARADLSPLMLMGSQPGGQLTITTDVENYPGFPDGIMGPILMDHFRDQAARFGTELVYKTAMGVDFAKRPFSVDAEGTTYTADAVILSTGASARLLGMESETRLMGHGVSACATCDGFFFREKPVAVIGGGNTAVEEALFLTNFATKVSLIHRRDELRADKILQDRLFGNDKIEPVWDSVLEEVLGADNPPGVTGARIKNVKSGEASELSVEGIFIAIGHDPNTELFKGQLDMDDDRYIITAPDSTATSVPGVFATGDVQDKVYRQAVTAAGTGCMGALEAERFLAENPVEAEAAE